ncbi:MAG TPA: transposase, partial [Desulforhopalus sp.]|nr:transposase [Desulforhopalus sp.]
MREIARVDGRPKVVSQIYLGSPEKVAGLLTQRDKDTIELKVEEFGALWLAAQVDQYIDLSAIVDQVIPRAERETGPSL